MANPDEEQAAEMSGPMIVSVPSGPVPKPIELAAGSGGQASEQLPRAGECRYLAGFMSAPQFVQHLQAAMARIEAVDEPALFQRHGIAAEAVKHLAPVSLDPGDLAPLDTESERAWVREVVSDPSFQQIYGNQQVVFAHVPIGRLGTFQPFVKPLHTPMPTDAEGILKRCLPKHFSTSYELQLLPGAPLPRIVFTTEDPSSLLHVAPSASGAVIALAPRQNWVQVAVTQDRLVVRNGYHRIVALAAAGHTTVPAIVSVVPHLAEVIPPGPGWLSAEYLLGLARPPMVTDFLNRALCIDVPQPAKKRLFEVRLALSEIPIAK